MWFRLKPIRGRAASWHVRKRFTTESWCVPICRMVYNGILGCDTESCETCDEPPSGARRCKTCLKKIGKDLS